MSKDQIKETVEDNKPVDVFVKNGLFCELGDVEHVTFTSMWDLSQIVINIDKKKKIKELPWIRLHFNSGVHHILTYQANDMSICEFLSDLDCILNRFKNGKYKGYVGILLESENFYHMNKDIVDRFIQCPKCAK